MLNRIKLLLGLDNDTDRDELLKLLISLVIERLTAKLGGITPPVSLDYIIIDVVVSRFNRIGSEGLTSHSVEGESLTFSDDDFAKFESDIQDYLNSLKSSKKGKVCFL